MHLTWLSQGGMVFESGGARLVVDPYLSDVVERTAGVRRLVPAPLTVERLRPSALLFTHDHLDHLDPDGAPPLLRAYPRAAVYGPISVRDHLLQLEIPRERVTLTSIGHAFQVGPMRITPTVAHHSEPKAIGFLVESDGMTIYHTADTIYRADLAAGVRRLLARGGIDLLLVCINGKWGNMSAVDALRLVDELRPRAVVPMHWDLFEQNSVRPEAFIASCESRGCSSRKLPHGVPVRARDLLA